MLLHALLVIATVVAVAFIFGVIRQMTKSKGDKQ